VRNSIKKILCFCFTGLALLVFSIFLNAADPGSSEKGIRTPDRAFASAMKSVLADAAKPYRQYTFPSRLHIFELLIGAFLSVSGLAAIGLSFFRRKRKDLLLISFGIFCFLYGARTRAFQFLFDAPEQVWAYLDWFITYLINIPGYIFVEQIVGRGWKSSIRVMWQISAAFAILAISAGIFWQDPAAASSANNILVIAGLLVVLVNVFKPGLTPNRELRALRTGFLIFALFSFHANFAPLIIAGPFSQNFEPIGLLIFFCCLGYLVAHRFFQNETDLINIARELETARQIISFILPQEMAKIQGLKIAARYVPMAAMAGDFYDFLLLDEKRFGILIADVSGHGVPASLIGAMVKIAFVSQLPHANDPARVLAEINRILCGKLESDFVTAGYLYIDTEKNDASYAGAGHPPLFLWRQSEGKILEFRNKGLILGQFEDADFENIQLCFEPGDRFVLYTDGIFEASNPDGDIYGWDRFKAFIESNAALAANQFGDRLIDALKNWTGKRSAETLDDDLTLIVVDVENPRK
jgi:sigma-B regulation protein RsbU (phosphoserine phosphatase)